MMNELVSIIIPVYNAETTIKKCVNSVQKQSYENIEIILVNDGSQDNSLNLCQEFALHDDRIKVIDKVNSGVSATRNQGIIVAKGSYCCFVDSDDWIEEEHVQQLVEAIQQSKTDCVIQGYTRNDDDYVTRNFLKEKEYVLNELSDSSVVSIFSNGYIHPCWNKLFKLEILRTNNLLFRHDIYISEDSLFCIKYLEHCKSIKVIESVSYHYCDSSANDGLSKKVYDNIFEVYYLVYKSLEKVLNSLRCEENLKNQILIETLYPQFYVSSLKILRDRKRYYFKKKYILNDMLKRLNGEYILRAGAERRYAKGEKIIVNLILIKQYRLAGGLLKWVDREK